MEDNGRHAQFTQSSIIFVSVLQCYVPSIKNGMVERSGQMIDVGDSVNASCNAGYISNAQGGGSLSVECLPDRSLQGLDNFNCSCKEASYDQDLIAIFVMVVTNIIILSYSHCSFSCCHHYFYCHGQYCQ